MGLFRAIQNAMQEHKEKARIEAAPMIQRIEEGDLSYGAKVVCDRVPHLSLAAKPVAMQAYRRKIQCADSSEVCDVFEEMYEHYKQRGDMMAFNVSQWLGERLAREGSLRVSEKTSSDGGRTLYIPR